MTTYADLADLTDPVVAAEQADLDHASRRVDALLRARGIDPADVEDAGGLALLRDLTVALATAAAATRGAVEADSPLYAKARAYTQQAQEMARSLDRESLGVAGTGTSGAGYGSAPVGRA